MDKAKLAKSLAVILKHDRTAKIADEGFSSSKLNPEERGFVRAICQALAA